ncbi:MAG: helix-turn-helix transcriptional regulator [Bacteroidales bacterium]|nr:helix-turn-helix transcriptional regulator [Bacteroidales bacterium]
MHDIKTYKQVHQHTETISFRISRMEDIWDVRKGKQDEPHRHDYYTLLLVKQASGKHVIDFYEYPLAPNQLYFISPGQVHQVLEEEKSFGFAILFSSQFLIENNIPLFFIDDLALFNDYGYSPPLGLSSGEFEKLSAFAEEIIQINKSDLKFKDQAISSYLKLFLISSNNLCSLSGDNTQRLEAGNTILKNFKKLVNENYSTWRQTTDYANALNVSPDHLNRVVKSLVGKTAKEMIKSRIILAMKRLLYFSDLSTKEIGYQLGFTEPANFSTFFKKSTGVSPSDFRKNSNIGFS